MVSPSVTGPRDCFVSLSVFSLPEWRTTEEPHHRAAAGKLAASRWIRAGLGWAVPTTTSIMPVGSLVGLKMGSCPRDG